MAGCLRRAEGPDPAQYRRALQRALDEWQSRRRLAAAFAEEDAEIAARLGEDTMVDHEIRYRFKCRFCESRFSLEQQRDAHEPECGRIGEPQPPSAAPRRTSAMLHCRRCGAEAATIKEMSQHVLAVHRAERAALISASGRRYHADLRKMDAALGGGEPAEVPSLARPEHGAGPARAGAVPATTHAAPCMGGGPVCPTCGGPVPETTAQFVAELRTLGISEEQAFAASRAARRILAAANN